MKTGKFVDGDLQLSARTPWEVCRSEEIYSNGFFRLRRDHCAEENQSAATKPLYVLEMPDCVSIVPLALDGRIILVNQYRHAVGRWVLECPGGTINSIHEDPLNAAKRELLEETGYAAPRLVSVGTHDLNPGGQTTRVHTFVAEACEPIAESTLESFECLTTMLVTRQELTDLLRSSDKFQTTTLASLMLGLQHIDNRSDTESSGSI